MTDSIWKKEKGGPKTASISKPLIAFNVERSAAQRYIKHPAPSLGASVLRLWLLLSTKKKKQAMIKKLMDFLLLDQKSMLGLERIELFCSAQCYLYRLVRTK